MLLVRRASHALPAGHLVKYHTLLSDAGLSPLAVAVQRPGRVELPRASSVELSNNSPYDLTPGLGPSKHKEGSNRRHFVVPRTVKPWHDDTSGGARSSRRSRLPITGPEREGASAPDAAPEGGQEQTRLTSTSPTTKKKKKKKKTKAKKELGPSGNYLSPKRRFIVPKFRKPWEL